MIQELIGALNTSDYITKIAATRKTRSMCQFARGVDWFAEAIKAGPKKASADTARLVDMINAIETCAPGMSLVQTIARLQGCSGFRHPAHEHAIALSSLAEKKQMWGEDGNGFWKGVSEAARTFRAAICEDSDEWSAMVMERLNARLADRF